MQFWWIEIVLNEAFEVIVASDSCMAKRGRGLEVFHMLTVSPALFWQCIVLYRCGSLTHEELWARVRSPCVCACLRGGERGVLALTSSTPGWKFIGVLIVFPGLLTSTTLEIQPVHHKGHESQNWHLPFVLSFVSPSQNGALSRSLQALWD